MSRTKEQLTQSYNDCLKACRSLYIGNQGTAFIALLDARAEQLKEELLSMSEADRACAVATVRELRRMAQDIVRPPRPERDPMKPSKTGAYAGR